MKLSVDGETLDILCNDKLKILQRKDSYRFSIDAFLLANFVRIKKNERMLDIGTGCGIIPIYMAIRGYRNHMYGIEIQNELFKLAEKNSQLNGVSGQVHFFHGDIRERLTDVRKTTFQVIISNPPYTKRDTGRKNPGNSRLLARHESSLDLEGLVSAASSLLTRKGRFSVIYPAKRLAEVVTVAASHKLELKRLRAIHPRESEEANLFLAEFLKEGGSGVTFERPLYVYDSEGHNTEEICEYYDIKD